MIRSPFEPLVSVLTGTLGGAIRLDGLTTGFLIVTELCLVPKAGLEPARF